ncbi:hypothetical protein [Lignipirellula cremea]|uniref:Transmembrane protein n=1 Tax=Lignipirellula cremea TaxID=2528010 RepID=A0A518E0Z3_9BACT|nr:hypothetical protein [Lignipirellula cremea]QDU97768.1 hypothetical protein Pla8534_56240 [Lignipirellula cremea]
MAADLLAAAGLAEAAWVIEAIIVGGALAVIALVSVLGVVIRSLVLGWIAIVLLGCFTCLFSPWLLLAPFSPEDYQDPDVFSAAADFQFLGGCWIATTLLVIAMLVVTHVRNYRAARPNQRRCVPDHDENSKRHSSQQTGDF